MVFSLWILHAIINAVDENSKAANTKPLHFVSLGLQQHFDIMLAFGFRFKLH